MNPITFHASVAAHPDLVWLGVRDDLVYVRTARSGGPTCSLSLSTILSEPWSALEPVLVGARRARVLTYMTRIVGYYSVVSEWNRSKLAELADRRRTPHRLKGALALDGIPDEVIEALVAGGAEAVCDAKRPS